MRRKTGHSEKNAGEFFGWKLVSVLWCLDFCNMGIPLFAGAVINVYMLSQIPMNRSMFGLGFTLLNLFVGLPSMAIARSIVRCGVRVTFVIGALVVGAGALWLAFLTFRPWQYLVGFGVLIGIGMGFGTNVPVATAITRWFRKYRGRAMSIALTASGVGGFIGAPLLGRIISSYHGNFRVGWIVVAGVSALSAASAYFFVVEYPSDLGQTMDGQPDDLRSNQHGRLTALVTEHTWTARDAYRTLSYWMIIAGAVACLYPFFFLTAHWILYLRGLGVTVADATWAMATFTITNIVGRLLGGFLIDFFHARYVFILGLICYLVASVLMLGPMGPLLWRAMVAASLFGSGFGCCFICMSTIIGNFFSHEAVPKLNGMMMLITAIVCSPAGLIGGKLFDVYRSYVPAFELNVLVTVLGIIAMAFARMPKPFERQTSVV